jgi:hypothetical protein
MTRTEAESQIAAMLDVARGDADAVERAIDNGRRTSREHESYTETDEASYALLKLALADLTGDGKYRR